MPTDGMHAYVAGMWGVCQSLILCAECITCQPVVQPVVQLVAKMSSVCQNTNISAAVMKSWSGTVQPRCLSRASSG
jgi:hypothetical protein